MLKVFNFSKLTNQVTTLEVAAVQLNRVKLILADGSAKYIPFTGKHHRICVTVQDTVKFLEQYVNDKERELTELDSTLDQFKADHDLPSCYNLGTDSCCFGCDFRNSCTHMDCPDLDGRPKCANCRS